MSYLSHSLLSKRRFRNILVAILVIAVISIILVVPFESSAPNAKIHNLFDALWWVITTIISGGYGDVVPVTSAGRVVGILLHVAAALFSVIFVLIGVTMAQSAEHFHFKRIQERLDEIESKLEAVHKHQKVHQSLTDIED